MNPTTDIPVELAAQVATAARYLAHGQVVAFPTETVYGLGANALDADAVLKIFQIKGRPQFNPLIVHIASLNDLYRVVSEVPSVARKLAERFWPGPLTLVLPKSEGIPDVCTAGLSTVGVRIPAHPIALRLIEAAGVPIAAPSANLFMQLSPTQACDVAQLEGVAQVLDGGPCAVGVESTIIGFEGERAYCLRPGGLALEEIESVTGPLLASPALPSDHSPRLAPGMYKRHYAPHTPVYLAGQNETPIAGVRTGLLCFETPLDSDSFSAVEVLSPFGNLSEAATRLFSALRKLDQPGKLDVIFARPFPNEGLGMAINDRLDRAAEGRRASDFAKPYRMMASPKS